MKRFLLGAIMLGCSSAEDTSAPAVDSAIEETSMTDTGATPVEDTTPVDSTAGDVALDATKGCKAKLCDGFEGYSEGFFDPTIWTKAITGTGTIAVTNTMAHTGYQSLEVVSPSGSYETFLKETVTFPATKNSFWGRVWFRFEESMPKDFVHWTLFEARGSTSNNRIRYGGINNPHGGSFFTDAFLFNVETQGMGEKGVDDDATPEIPTKTWICVEWNYIGESGKNESRLFWNGVERPKMHIDTAWFETQFVMPEMNAFYLGWAIYQPISTPYVVHIDDVAIDDARIGCD
ncbi:MAG: hypothetical protein ACXVEE_16230 [Polyangiales bacterium]